MSAQNTRVEQIMAQLKNHPILALVIAFGLIVIGIASFTEATNKIVTLARDLLSDKSYEIKGDIRSPAVEVRWNGYNNRGWRHPIRNVEYENELRLRLSLKNIGNVPAVVEGLRILTDWDGREIIWEGVYEADNLPLIPAAPIEPQIQKHRNQLLPFSITGRNAVVFKTIDFTPINYTEPLAFGTYKNILQIKESSSDVWLNVLSFTFTIPSDFKLVEFRHGSKSPSILRYWYWQSFDLLQPGLTTK